MKIKRKWEDTSLISLYHSLPRFSQGESLSSAHQQQELAVIPGTKRSDHQIHSNEELALEENPSLGQAQSDGSTALSIQANKSSSAKI